jgi:hypothetical protein
VVRNLTHDLAYHVGHRRARRGGPPSRCVLFKG